MLIAAQNELRKKNILLYASIYCFTYCLFLQRQQYIFHKTLFCELIDYSHSVHLIRLSWCLRECLESNPVPGLFLTEQKEDGVRLSKALIIWGVGGLSHFFFNFLSLLEDFWYWIWGPFIFFHVVSNRIVYWMVRRTYKTSRR